LGQLGFKSAASQGPAAYFNLRKLAGMNRLSVGIYNHRGTSFAFLRGDAFVAGLPPHFAVSFGVGAQGSRPDRSVLIQEKEARGYGRSPDESDD
jgi:hypothetical protein